MGIPMVMDTVTVMDMDMVNILMATTKTKKNHFLIKYLNEKNEKKEKVRLLVLL